MPKTWVNVGTEIVTKANVNALYPRETDHAAETKWYTDYSAKNFGDLNARRNHYLEQNNDLYRINIDTMKEEALFTPNSDNGSQYE